jgi:hypothetical protein
MYLYFLLKAFLHNFRNLRKIAKSDCYFRHVCLSLLMEQLGFQERVFMKIYILVFFGNLSRKRLIKI